MATSLKGIRHTEDNAQDKDYYDLPTNVNNKGFLYEEYIFELLKDQNLVPAGFTPAGNLTIVLLIANFFGRENHIILKLSWMIKQIMDRVD